jgi:L-ascorbate metabolism protein UlaG (beta-lactamase superfamily)
VSVSVRWLGQAGFEVTASSGATCLLDPYLSDWCDREALVQRQAPVPVDVQSLRPTVVVTSHWHEDHLDPDTTRILAATSPSTVWAGPPANGARCLRYGVRDDRVIALDRGESATVGPFTVRAGFARHEVPGWICEDAISILLEVDGVRIFHSGDTEYDTRIVSSMAARGPIDVGLFAINGTGGNMNAAEAALLAFRLAPRMAIPMHYGMWIPKDYGPGATIDPATFEDAYRRLADAPARILEHGETIDVEAS